MGLAWVSHAQGAWPACDVLAVGNGGPAIRINGDTHTPIFFAGNNQFGRDDVLLEELAHARDAGVVLYSFNLPLYGDDDAIVETVEAFHSVHPEGYFYVRMWIGAPKEWLEANPDKRMLRADGSAGDWASPFSETWQRDTVAAIRHRVKATIEGPHGDKFIGVLISYLQTGEWFYPETNEFWDYAPAAHDAFGGWLREKYEWSRRLRNVWHDDAVDFDSITIPSAAAREAAYWGPFRHPERDRAAIDYNRFLSEGMVDVIDTMAKAVKDETRGRSLVGAFYGYTHELNHNGPRALGHSGHLALGALLESENIDLIHAPYSYLDRAPGEPGLHHLPAAGIANHGKLLVIEDDTYTHMASPPPEGVIAPGASSGATDIDETRAVTWRTFANAFSQGAGVWRFDLLSDGRWNDRALWSDMGSLRRIAAEARSATGLHPEVAVIVDEESIALLRSDGLGNGRSDWARTGAYVSYYLRSDLEALPDTVRVIALPNAYALEKNHIRWLQRFAESGGMVIIQHATGVYGEDGPDAGNIASLTGMETAAEFDGAPVIIQSLGDDGAWPIARDGWNPRFVVSNPGEDGTVLATYDDGTTAAAVRPLGEGSIVYCGVPRIPSSLLSSLLDEAGVHRYTTGDASIAVVGRYLFVHTLSEGTHTFTWPNPCIRIERIAPSYPATVALGSPSWADTLPAHRTFIYRCTEGEVDPEDLVIKQLMKVMHDRNAPGDEGE